MSELNPVLATWWEMCRRLGLVPDEEPTLARCEEKIQDLSPLIRSATTVTGRRVHPGLKEQERGNKGLWVSLRSCLPKVGVEPKLETLRDCVYLFHGFVRSGTDWVFVRELENPSEPELFFLERVSERLVDRLWDMEKFRRREFRDYLEQSAARMSKAKPLPAMPWIAPRTFERGHEFITQFLQAARVASSDVALAAVHLHITMSIGRTQLLELTEREGMRVRILIYDFVKAEGIEHVARALGRSVHVLQALCNDSAEALEWLHEKGSRERLEIRVLSRDPGVRSYIVNGHQAAKHGAHAICEAFVASRGPSTRSTQQGGDWLIQPAQVRERFAEFESLWEDESATPFEQWRHSYEEWRLRSDTRHILGEDLMKGEL